MRQKNHAARNTCDVWNGIVGGWDALREEFSLKNNSTVIRVEV
jgi:hypothetical protein